MKKEFEAGQTVWYANSYYRDRRKIGSVKGVVIEKLPVLEGLEDEYYCDFGETVGIVGVSVLFENQEDAANYQLEKIKKISVKKRMQLKSLRIFMEQFLNISRFIRIWRQIFFKNILKNRDIAVRMTYVF